MKQPDPDRWRFATAGLELVGAVVLLAWIGHLIDGWLNHTRPYGLIAGALIAIAGGLYRLTRDVMKLK